jgi:SAM-dependent methyltransferase
MRRTLTTAADAANALARCYDLDMLDVSYDAELYLRLAQETGGPVLELAVGSGRLAIPLALAGYRVVGVDHDPAMLARARLAWRRERGSLPRDRLRLVEGDLVRFRSEERFGLALIAVNTFLLAQSDGERKAVLETMRRHLRPGGLAAIEMSTPGAEELRGYDGRLRLEWRRRDPETGALVSKHIAARYDARAASVTLRQSFAWRLVEAPDGPLQRASRTDVLHLVEPSELARLALAAGFSGVDVWGDHLLIPHGAGSHRAILIARLV